MPTSAEIHAALDQVHDHASFLQVLVADTLGWPVGDKVKAISDIAYDWTGADLRAEDLDQHLHAWQIQPFRKDQPWGIFLLEFADAKVYRTLLRQVLRGLVPSRRKAANQPAWQHDNLLFLCTTKDYQRFTFAHFKGDKAQTARLITFGWEPGDSNVRTVCEFNLPALAWPEDGGQDTAAWLKDWARAFDKEPLTKDFFRRFDRVAGAVQADLEKHQGLSSAMAYSKAQLLLERLIFLYFLQNRGWLDQQRAYLVRAFQEHRANPKAFSFYHDFLERLFFTLATAPGHGWRLEGIPFLNGGLFDDDEFDPGPVRKKNNPPLNITNAACARVFDELLEAFNFTVREDTPLDQDVAVDPEMLGKVFESIVLHAEAADPDAVAPDKRKATGSYYTPRIVVHFICRETLYQYLRRHLEGDGWEPRLKALLEMDASHGLSGDNLTRLRTLLTPAEGVAVRDLIKDLKCCDPAVGSGAFPVGLLHELVNLRRLVEAAANGYVDPVRLPGASWIHDTKEDIVQNGLFGVDLQQQAIEICRLRLWLTLVVDYDLGIDSFSAGRPQFLAAITKISQLPNLEMNFHRGDSLLDLISDVPVRIEPGAMKNRGPLVKELQALGGKLHKAKNAARKKELRLDILRRRLDLTETVLQDQVRQLSEADASLSGQLLFGEELPDKEKRRRIALEMAKMKEALVKIQTDRKDLEKLAKSQFAADFYPKLRRLEGADFNSPFNFAWRLDFAGIFGRDKPGFDIVVGNPPFVTARNPCKRELYRERWKRVCSGKFLLICPFFDLSFGLLRPDGQLGFIVSNAFGKREFGQPLIEDFLPTVDVQKVVDCSGLMFPGHGTPTCIVFGAQRKPNVKTPIRVAALLPGGGDLRTAPEESPVWHTLAAQHDSPGFANEQLVVADRSRKELGKWPWNLDAGKEPTKQAIEATGHIPLRKVLACDVGFDLITGSDDFFVFSPNFARRFNLPAKRLRLYFTGEDIRNWGTSSERVALFPYENRKTIELKASGFDHYAQLFKQHLRDRLCFGKTAEERGMKWWEYAMVMWSKRNSSLRVGYSQIATHGHFVTAGDEVVFKEKAPIIKLPDKASEADYDLLSALINSSSALFWLKQVCFNKGAGEDEHRDRFEYAGGKVDHLPTPPAISDTLRGKPDALAVRLMAVSHACRDRGQALPTLALRKLFERTGEAYHAWNSALPGWLSPAVECGPPFASTPELGARLAAVVQHREQLRAGMIARQEEMDWLVYGAFGLIEDLGPALPEEASVLAREERPFCLWASADGDFGKAAALIPAKWSAAKKALWKQRLEIIRNNEHIRRIEQPVYKRRWDEQWKIGNSWQCGQPAYDAEFLDAFAWWLSEKAEWWLENKKRGGSAELAVWTEELWADPRVKAAWPVAAEARQRLDHWKLQQAEGPVAAAPVLDAGQFAFARFFKALVKDQAVPENIPWAKPWEEIEKKHKVSANVKRIRGKLNVPRERFWLTADGSYRVPRLTE